MAPDFPPNIEKTMEQAFMKDNLIQSLKTSLFWLYFSAGEKASSANYERKSKGVKKTFSAAFFRHVAKPLNRKTWVVVSSPRSISDI